MIIGSVLRKFSKIELSTADDKHYILKNNFVSRMAFGLIGVPHLGFRARAKIIFKEILQSPKSTRILDAGCGYGLYALTLAEKGYYVDSIDLDQKRIGSLNALRQESPASRERISAHQGSLTNLPFFDNSYDLIICSDVIEHIADDQASVRELARVLKSGGKLILSVPYNSRHNQKIFRMFSHERPGYTRKELTTLFNPYGLHLKKDYYYEYWLGARLFGFFNSLNSKTLMGIFFYPCYSLYLLDRLLTIGEPNGIVIVAEKKS